MAFTHKNGEIYAAHNTNNFGMRSTTHTQESSVELLTYVCALCYGMLSRSKIWFQNVCMLFVFFDDESPKCISHLVGSSRITVAACSKKQAVHFCLQILAFQKIVLKIACAETKKGRRNPFSFLKTAEPSTNIWQNENMMNQSVRLFQKTKSDS